MELKRKTPKRFDRRARSKIAIGAVAVSVIAVVVAVFANLALVDYSRTHDVRFDLTAGKRHQLSDATVELVRRVDSPVDVYVTFGLDEAIRKAALPAVGAQRPDSGIVQQVYQPLLAYLAARITDVANECRLLNSKFRYRVLDATSDFDTHREWTRILGIGKQDLVNRVIFHNPETRTQKSFSFYELFLLDLGGPMPGQPRRLPLERGDFLEAAFSIGLNSVISQERRIAYFTQGHQEVELPAVESVLKGEGYEVRLANPSARGVIPNDADLLVIGGGGSPWAAHALRGVAAFLERGGRLLLLQGGFCREPFQPILEPFGVTYQQFQLGHATAHRRGQTAYYLYGWDFLGPEKKVTPHSVVSRLIEDKSPLYWGFTRPYTLLDDRDREAVRRDVLAHVGSDGHAVPYRFDGRSLRQRPDLGVKNGDQPFMLALERTTQAEKPARVIACGSDQWLGERELQHTYHLGNLDLLRNSVHWLTDSNQPMTATPRRFRGHTVNLSHGDADSFRFLSLVLIPVSILLCGLIVLVIRRR